MIVWVGVLEWVESSDSRCVRCGGSVRSAVFCAFLVVTVV